MAQWKYTIDVSDPWEAEDMHGIVDIVEGYEEVPRDIVEGLREAADDGDVAFFDSQWGYLYDWADEALVWVQVW